MKKKVLLVAMMTLSLTACSKPMETRIHVDNGYMNVRDMGDGYVHYEIIDRDILITCRERNTGNKYEHVVTCWPTAEEYPDEGF